MDSQIPHTMRLDFIAYKPLISFLGNMMMINIRSYVGGNSFVCSSMFTPFVATFLLGNYKQLSQLLEELPSAITSLESGKSHKDTRYHQHLESERAYLLSCRQESPEEEFACEYIELLIMHQKAKYILAILLLRACADHLIIN
jgi:hypothetical protein